MSLESRSRRAGPLAALTACALALGACETVQDALGVSKIQPDEFQTAPKRPLVMPPDYALRAPEPGAAPRTEVDARGAAAEAIANAGAPGAAPPAGGAAPAPQPQGQPTRPPTTSGGQLDDEILGAPGRR